MLPMSRPLTAAIACSLLAPSPALAGPSGPASPALAAETPDAVSIVYTAMAGGLYSTWATVNEMEPLFDSEARGNVTTEGMTLDLGILHLGPYYIWSDLKPLTPRDAKPLFAGGGIRLLDRGLVLPTLTSDFAELFEMPGDAAPWLVEWLADQHRRRGEMPDVRASRGAIFQAMGEGGVPLLLFSKDGSTPPPAVLRDHLPWQCTIGAKAPLQRGKEKTRLITFATHFGGLRLHHLADEKRAETDGLRVDTGNLVGDPNSTFSSEDTEDLLAQLPGMKLDALVPDYSELRLARPLQEKLSHAAPLVAANLTPPAGVTVRPFVIRERKGRRVALIGIADTVHFEQFGLVGAHSGWSGEDPVKALQRTLKDVHQNQVDAIVIVTNLSAERLNKAFRNAADGVAAVITRGQPHTEHAFRERFEPLSPERTREPRPWMIVGADRAEVGVLTLGFRTNAKGPARGHLAWAENAIRTAIDDHLLPADAERYWRTRENQADHLMARSDAVLPDMRVLSSRDVRLVNDRGVALLQFRRQEWTRLAASALREGANAEIGVLHSLQTGTNIVGEIPRHIAEEWFGAETPTVLDMSGEQLKQLAAMDPDRTRFGWAGFDPSTGLVGGRPLKREERYRVATTEGVAASETYMEIFKGSPTSPLKLAGESLRSSSAADATTLRAVLIARLVGLRERLGGFSDPFKDALIGHLTDNGERFEPRWRLQVKPLEGSFQQFQVANREPFGAVRNSLINAPDSTIVGGKGNVALTYETADLDWENRGIVGYQRAEFKVPGQSEPQEQVDNVQLTSEFRLKVFKLQTQKSALELIPFVNGNYLTEFTPTVDPKTQIANERRREINGITGVVLYPGTWLKEIRLGAIAKNDLAVQVGGFEPGVQLASILEQPLGPAKLVIESDFKHYFLTPEDTADDLGLLGRVSTSLRFPLWGALGLSVGVDGFVFNGKIPATRSLGVSYTPTIGLTYTATWKPQLGVWF